MSKTNRKWTPDQTWLLPPSPREFFEFPIGAQVDSSRITGGAAAGFRNLNSKQISRWNCNRIQADDTAACGCRSACNCHS